MDCGGRGDGARADGEEEVGVEKREGEEISLSTITFFISMITWF